MNLIVVDRDTDAVYWTVEQCAEHCGISRSSWTAYVARGIAPQPGARFNSRTPMWAAHEVESWHSTRPGRGNWSVKTS